MRLSSLIEQLVHRRRLLRFLVELERACDGPVRPLAVRGTVPARRIR